jgi:FtsP/CotA-like multicopper oxidase with cupredoxin domain
MHLHGHDFALLRQSGRSWYGDNETEGDQELFTPDKLNCDNELIKCDNPPRRDVVLLPASGYVIIAFKADNPGYVFFFFPFFPLLFSSPPFARNIGGKQERLPKKTY